jgi:hypothetical protein
MQGARTTTAPQLIQIEDGSTAVHRGHRAVPKERARLLMRWATQTIALRDAQLITSSQAGHRCSCVGNFR